jgi:hypothetical protein
VLYRPALRPISKCAERIINYPLKNFFFIMIL